MKKNMLFTLLVTLYTPVVVLSGCSTVKEMGKGFLGVSTQVLEEKRPEAVKESFALDYESCYTKVKDILSKKEKEKIKVDGVETEIEAGSYVYAEDAKKRMLGIYLSDTDTTPVGIFFTEESPNNTLIEVSSPSVYAKEEIADRIFTGIKELIKPKTEEKKTDVKEKLGN